MTRPPRVLHVVHSLGSGGMENGVVNVANRLEDSAEAEVRVVSLTREGEFARRLRPGRVSALGKGEGFDPRTVLALRAVVRDFRPDVVHTHNLGPLIYAVPAAFGLAPILHGEHASLTDAERSRIGLLKRRLLYARTAAVHGVSAMMSREIEDLRLGGGPVFTVRNGVDTARFQPREPAAPPDAAWPRDALVVGLVARFGRDKGHERLLEAWENVRVRHRARLVLVGAGGPREAAVKERLAGLPWRDEVLLAGFQADPAPWYTACDLLVLPSTNEGLSNMTLEAMASGRPVLTHGACGATEIIADDVDGWVRDLASPASLAAELDRALALGREGLRRVGHAARVTIEQRWSIESMVDGYRSLYRRIAFPVAHPGGEP